MRCEIGIDYNLTFISKIYFLFYTRWVKINYLAKKDECGVQRMIILLPPKTNQDLTFIP